MAPLLGFFLRCDTEEIAICWRSVFLTRNEYPFVGRRRYLPILEGHDAIQDVLGQLQVLLAVSSQVKLLGEAFDVQILEACL